MTHRALILSGLTVAALVAAGSAAPALSRRLGMGLPPDRTANPAAAAPAAAAVAPAPAKEPLMNETLAKTDAEWRQALTPEQYQVARCSATERAFTGKYWNDHRPGEYHCVACGALLFDAKDKFDSGTGWPSFTRPVANGRIQLKKDTSYGMTRTEACCARCGAHLGHVFDDGPAPTGARYCINSAVLQHSADR